MAKAMDIEINELFFAKLKAFESAVLEIWNKKQTKGANNGRARN